MNKYRDFDNYLKEYPSHDGYFGKYGGNYLEDPELIRAFNEYAEAYNTIAQSAQFIAELRRIRRDFQGRPTPVYHCQMRLVPASTVLRLPQRLRISVWNVTSIWVRLILKSRRRMLHG